MTLTKLIVSIAVIVIIGTIFGNGGCMPQSCVRQFGGTIKIELPPGQKLITTTWKGGNFFYLYREMSEGEVPETYTFQEKSVFGIFESTVILREQPRGDRLKPGSRFP